LGQPLREASDILQPDDLVGVGGMGQVFVARDTRLERHVAIKLLHPDLGDSALATARFEREAKMLSLVVHPNAVVICDCGKHNGAFYIVMAYVDGESLADWLGRKGPMQLDEVLTVTRQVASGLAEAHALGIIHRDIKPAICCCVGWVRALCWRQSSLSVWRAATKNTQVLQRLKAFWVRRRTCRRNKFRVKRSMAAAISIRWRWWCMKC